MQANVGEDLAHKEMVNVIHLKSNMDAINYSRILGSTLAGCTAGILGLTNLFGFVFYFLASGLLSLLLVGMAKGDLKHTVPSPLDLLWNGTMGNLLCYIFWWTFVYGIVYVY